MLVLAFAEATAGQVQASLIFEYSLTDKIGSGFGSVAGTVTGKIYGLSDNSTGAASQVTIETYPAGLGSIFAPGSIDATAWTLQGENSFTVVAGLVTDGSFSANQGDPLTGDFVQLSINDGPYNFVIIRGVLALYLEGNDGFDAANIVSASSAVREPTSLRLVGLGALGLVTGVIRRRRQTKAAV
ncbi:MAG: hypothetical protein EXS36_04845 [Pedosphaera sp.]|nr:hypothetical protein [Pedosphaera sp.]